jgi:hypothetical protein
MSITQIIHKHFVDGRINSEVFKYMTKIANNGLYDKSLFNAHLDAINMLKIGSDKECKKYFDIYSYAIFFIKKITNKDDENTAVNICKFGFDNKNNYDFSKKHNLIKLCLDFFINEKYLEKIAYPNNMGIESMENQQPQYDVDKWIKVMKYIYDIANTNNLSLDVVTKQATSNWDEKEKDSFINWMKYYQEGNHSKYNVKTAQFFVNKPNNTTELSGIDNILNNKPVIDPSVEKKKRIDDARKKLRSRLKSILELLDQFRDVLPREDNDAMRKDVFDLNERIWNLEYKQSMVDSIMRTSNQFVKRGFIEGANELKKIAQEVAENKIPDIKPEIKQELKQNVPVKQDAEAVQKEQINKSLPEKEDILQDMPPAVEQTGESAVLSTGVIEIPDFSSASYKDALVTLEKVNQIISERGVVRALAAVDIILASLNIASHFPGLNESMSKLMDAFQYAESRVSTVISQLRGSMGSQLILKKDDESIKEEKEKPKEEVVETEEDMNKPVGEVVSGPPDIQPPKPSVIP